MLCHSGYHIAHAHCPGKDHPDVAQSLNFLACLRLEQNIIDLQTETMYLDALHIAEVLL